MRPPKTSNVTSLEWVRDRIAHTLDEVDVDDIEARLEHLRTATDEENTAAAAEAAPQLVEIVAGLPPTTCSIPCRAWPSSMPADTAGASDAKTRSAPVQAPTGIV